MLLCSRATTHIPQVQLDRVLFYECDHRADELIGLKVDVSGEFIAEFELVFVQEPLKKITSRLFSRARRGTVCRELKWALLSAAQPKSARRGHHRTRHAALPRRAPSRVDRLSIF